jgi:esterase/lipase superfamily enzyme
MSKKAKWIAGAVVLLAAAALWLYFVVFVSTGNALHHAEAFRFRRMTVGQLGEQDKYRYFYVTNRVPADNETRQSERFGSAREERLKFGTFDTRIEPALGLGMLINPTQWFRDEEIRIDDVSALERGAFIDHLREMVDKSPRRSLLVIVHGFREVFPSALRKTAFVGHVLDINSPILVFDWPGNQGGTPRGYRRAREVAKASGAELAATLQLIIEEVRAERLWLLANSMGGQVVVDAFSLLYEDPALADAEIEIEDVILTAPDVDHAEFNEKFRDEITALTDNLSVYVSSNDRALVMSRLINRSARLGESTLSPDQLDEAARLVELIEPGSDLIALIDVTPVNRTRNFHNFSLETPEFYDDLFLRLTTDGLPRSRPIYQLRTGDGAVYWVLTRGR